uniref:C-type lectin domain-containing protein n=1 Tax=Labrus bergylta TaxID=56723 RepID=A0A3Q3ETC7_9LABR
PESFFFNLCQTIVYKAGRTVVDIGFEFKDPSLYMHRQFHYINLKMTWADAQHYCRDKYTDLATIESVSDISRLNRPGISKAWIGLHDDPEAWKMTMGNETISWRWSTTGVTSKTGYYSWQINQPDNGPRAESCVQATADGKWDAVNCYRRWYFVCYTAKQLYQCIAV